MSSRGSSSEEVLEFFEQELARAYLVGDDELDPRVAAVGRSVLYHEDVVKSLMRKWQAVPV